MQREQDLWDKFWKDSRGNVVVWQRPNIFLIAWVVLTIVSLFIISRGPASDGIAIAGNVSLVIWSLLEVLKGASYFRRLLGLVVLLFAVLTLLKNF